MDDKHAGPSEAEKKPESKLPWMVLFQKNNIPISVALAVFVLLCVITTVYAVRDIRVSNYNTNAHGINVVMGNLGRNLDLVFDAKWDNVHRSARHILNHTPNGVEELAELLTDMYEEDAKESVNYYLLDSLGNAYYNDGRIEHWKYALAVNEYGDSGLLTEPDVGTNMERLMVYISPLVSHLTVGERELTHIVFTEPVTAFDKFFDTTSYDESSLSYIITRDGNFIYESDMETKMSQSYNLLKYLSNEDNVSFMFGESFESFYEDFLDESVNSSYLVSYDGGRYYLSFYGLKMHNWYSVMLVPEMNIENDTKKFTEKIVKDIVSLFISITSVFMLFLMLIWRRSLAKQRRATEAERISGEAKTDFLSSMSHDIRTPMNAIMGMTQIALHNYDKPELVKQNLMKINTSSMHMLTLINDILDINKIEAGKMPLNIEEVSVKSEVDTIVSIVRPLAEAKDIMLGVSVELQQDRVHCDSLRINQLCLNLLTNAVKYTQNGGQVDFRVGQESVSDKPNMLKTVIVISDNGIGMSEEFQKHMYESFARETDSRVNKIAGSGLGLSICRQLVTLMNGEIDCRSKTGEGTTFTISLEMERGRQDKDLAEGDGSAMQGMETDAADADLSGMLVLVAEDNDMNWDVLETILEMHGVKAERAENGKLALDMLDAAEEGYYNAVLMDVRMPVMDGREATRRIRASKKPWIKKLPVVAMTADAFAEDIKACLDAGMDAHLSKPISTPKLIQTLNLVLCKLPLRGGYRL